MTASTQDTTGTAQAPVITAASGTTTPAAGSRFLNGRLTTLGHDTASALHDRYKAKTDKLVEDAFALAAPAMAEKNLTRDTTNRHGKATLHQAAHHYATACARTRRKITPAELAKEIALGPDTLLYNARGLLENQTQLDLEVERRIAELKRKGKFQVLQKEGVTPPLLQRLHMSFNRTLAKMLAPLQHTSPWEEPRDKVAPALPPVLSTLPWDANERIYFKLDDDSQSPVAAAVAEALAKKGCTITDYALNRAVDDRKNERKIGKLLADQPGLLRMFEDDPARSSKKLMVVLTRSVGDVARGSIDRGWQSCRADIHNAARYAAEEVNTGVMSAYLVSEDDPDITNPLSRINIKPYDRITSGEGARRTTVDNTDTIYAPFNPIGLHHAGFADAVYSFVEDLNAGKTGKFRLRQGCENYREFEQRRLLPAKAEAALKELGIKYKKGTGGVITVQGDLPLNDMGLLRLPDFSRVIVTGTVDVSGNRLLTLEGTPQAPAEHLKARGNLLICFAGAAASVRKNFDYRDNAWLMSTLGAPAASTYTYGNTQGWNDKNHTTGSTCVGPIDDPKRFPGFKRA